MCELVSPFLWRLCDGSGWKSTYRFSLDRYERAALAIRPRLAQEEMDALSLHLWRLNEARLVEKGRAMSDDHVKQEAVKWARAR